MCVVVYALKVDHHWGEWHWSILSQMKNVMNYDWWLWRRFPVNRLQTGCWLFTR